MMTRNSWIRCHNKIRGAKLTPMKVARGPKKVEEVGNIRVSIFRKPDSKGYDIHLEEWKQLKEPHKVISPTTGYTVFLNESELPAPLKKLEVIRM